MFVTKGLSRVGLAPHLALVLIYDESSAVTNTPQHLDVARSPVRKTVIGRAHMDRKGPSILCEKQTYEVATLRLQQTVVVFGAICRHTIRGDFVSEYCFMFKIPEENKMLKCREMRLVKVKVHSDILPAEEGHRALQSAPTVTLTNIISDIQHNSQHQWLHWCAAVCIPLTGDIFQMKMQTFASQIKAVTAFAYLNR
ncbi:uncharacterized protein V6R79_002769 [Siganus canaliculatus]